jgi:23S rRNA (uridine2552-2'-O)-methyltransferase
LEIAKEHLLTGGHLAVKVFQGGDSRELEAGIARLFSSVRRLKPKACRKESFEVYIVGMEKKGK